jgi:hypothetical protein
MELTADIAPKDALTYIDLATRVYGPPADDWVATQPPLAPDPVTPARLKSIGRACRRLAEIGAVELWERLEYRHRGRPRFEIEDFIALEAAREAGDEEMAAFFDPPYSPPDKTLTFVAAVSRPLSELERRRLKRAYSDWQEAMGDWEKLQKYEGALEAQRRMNVFAAELNRRKGMDETLREALRAQLRDRQAEVDKKIAENKVDPEWFNQLLLTAEPDPLEAIGIQMDVMPREGLFQYLRRL